MVGCTVIAVGKKASADGSNLISHTDTGQDSRIFVVPRQNHPPGSQAPVYWGIQDATLPLEDDGEILGYIPQVTTTYKYFHSAYSHVNEYQLGIAESTTTQRAPLVCMKDNGEQIMTIEQAQIFALQRCQTAREAVNLIGELMLTYGFLPSCYSGSESLVIADPKEIWVFEVNSIGPGWKRDSGDPGAVWAAQRLPEEHATIIPNWSIIKEIDVEDKSNFIVSSNYKQEAIDRGWYDPDSGKPFIWQEAYSPIPAEYATGRFWLFHQTFAPNHQNWPDRYLNGDSYKGLDQYHQFVEPLSIYPFSVRPEKKMSVQDIMAFQRSTFEGTIYDMTAGPQWLIPNNEGKLEKSPLATPFPGNDMRKLLGITHRRPIARRMGNYGMVLQLRDWLPDEIGGVYWVYLDNPYISPYVPIYVGNSSVHESYKTYDPKKYSERSARWLIDFVDNLARLKFQEISKYIKSKREPFEADIFDEQSSIEQEALSLYKKNPGAVSRLLTDYSNKLMVDVCDLYLTLRDEIISKFSNNND